MKKSDFQNSIRIYKNRIDRRLKEVLPKNTISPLSNSIEYAVLNGGKRLRPILVYLAAELSTQEVNPQSLDDVATAVELMHCYSLIHDDLPAMDNDDLRRGLPTCHIAFDEATAILTGDALQPLAYEIILKSSKINNQDKIYILKKITEACGYMGMVEGQMLDMMSFKKKFSLKELDAMHNLKTGELIRTSLIIGGKIAKYNDKELSAINDYGKKIGLAFQIRDDIIDIECSSEITGKTQGSDILKDKITYPALIGLEEANNRAKKIVKEAIQYLEVFSEDTTQLIKLAHYVIERES